MRKGAGAAPGTAGYRLAAAAALVTFLLLAVGGIVTSRDAGMVFPDWPLSDGSVNPDGWLRDADKLSEHGHRILGAAAGLLTLLLAFRLHRRDPRRGVRVLGWTALGFVVAQGVLGGLRVTEVSTELALVHGCTGQVFLCMTVALWYLTSRDATEPVEPVAGAGPLAICAGAVLVTVFFQIVVGARLRHVGGPLFTHVLGAFLVAGCTMWLLTVALLRHGGRRALVRPVYLLAGLVLAQIGLGIATANALRNFPFYRPTLAQVALPSAHQATGALLLATSLVIVLRARRRMASVREVREAYA